jgi:hypothetical protein
MIVSNFPLILKEKIMEPAQILAHYENTFPGIRAEWIDDQIVPKAVPGGYHSFVEFQSVLTIGTKCKGKQRSDGRGGWWLMSEVSIDHPKSKRILQVDLAGWKRSRIASPPKEYPVSDSLSLVFSVVKKGSPPVLL